VFEVLATAGDTFLGGDDIDSWSPSDGGRVPRALPLRSAQDDQAYERLRAAAEWAKCQLSDEGDVQLTRRRARVRRRRTCARPHVRARSRAPRGDDSTPLLARAFDVCEDAMRSRGPQADAARQRDARRRLDAHAARAADGRAVLRHAPPLGLDPDLVVAQGAAIQGYSLRDTRMSGAAERKASLGKIRAEAASRSSADVKAVKQRAELTGSWIRRAAALGLRSRRRIRAGDGGRAADGGPLGPRGLVARSNQRSPSRR
jgi:molecular chaperone DnaK